MTARPLNLEKAHALFAPAAANTFQGAVLVPAPPGTARIRLWAFIAGNRNTINTPARTTVLVMPANASDVYGQLAWSGWGGDERVWPGGFLQTTGGGTTGIAFRVSCDVANVAVDLVALYTVEAVS